jgi:hypothetical protein
MLKQFAPIAVIPPSPNNNACTTKATVTAIHAAQGPKSIATNAAPVACPVEPPGIGKLNIIITKLKAAPMAKSGTWRLLKVFLTIFEAAIHMGNITA